MTGIVTFTPNLALDVSTTIARVMPDHKLRCTAARYDPGGGGINVARVVRRLGGEVTAIYPRGGVTGLILDRLVECEKIARQTTDIAEATRLDFAAHEDASGKQFRFVLPGPTLAGHECRACLDRLGPALAPSSLWQAAACRRGRPRTFMRRQAASSKPPEADFCSTPRGRR